MRLLPLVLGPGDRDELKRRVRSNTVEARDAERARLVLMAADGASNREIGATIGMHYNQVAVWRRRYSEFGLVGLADGERSGRPPVYGHDDVLLLVKTVTEPPPDAATRWTMEAIAQRLSEHGVPISPSQVWRICRSLDLKPWQTESWMTSHDRTSGPRPPTCVGCIWTRPITPSCGRSTRSPGSKPQPVNPTKPAVQESRCGVSSNTAVTALLVCLLLMHESHLLLGTITDPSQAFVYFELLMPNFLLVSIICICRQLCCIYAFRS